LRPVAQLAEHVTLNHGVEGSIPSGPTQNMNEFDIKAAGWDQNAMHLARSEAIVKELIKQVPLNRNMIALEFGAGTGITSFILKDQLREITMMDSSSEMVKIMNGKIESAQTKNLKPILFDLEKDNWTFNKFDLIMTQMVLHHVSDTGSIIRKFYEILNPGGFLAIADLYPEDGSFHGVDFGGHKGFDTEVLSTQIREVGFINISSQKCYVMNKQVSDTLSRKFDVFLLTANRDINDSPGNVLI
jgi:tRNA (cmo5U34)-methyltransferase